MSNSSKYAVEGVVANAREKLKDTSHHLVDQATESVERAVASVKRHSAQTQQAVTSYVKKNPFKSLGWAALAGLVAGLVLRK